MNAKHIFCCYRCGVVEKDKPAVFVSNKMLNAQSSITAEFILCEDCARSFQRWFKEWSEQKP